MDKIDKRFADKIGAEYDLFPLAAPHYNELQRKLAELTVQYPVKNPVILEIGCGTGLTTAELHKARPDAKIIAIDAEEIMVEQTKSFLANTGIDIIWTDALEYLKKLEAISLDIVVSGFCLHNTPTEYRKNVFEEIGRVLKPNGLCINGDKIALDNEEEHKKTLEKQIEAFTKTLKEDVVSKPDLVSTKYPLHSAGWYFSSKCLTLCDAGATDEVITNVTKCVNGGTRGLDERKKYFYQYYGLLTK